MKAWEALKALQEDKKVRREHWDRNLYIYNDCGIVSMINKIQKQLKTKAEVKTMDFNLYN